MLIDLKCLTKEHGIFNYKILNNYATRIPDAKYESVDTTTLLHIKSIWTSTNIMIPNSLTKYDKLSWFYTHQKVHIHLISGPELVHHEAYTLFHALMNKHSKRNSNTWFTLEFFKSALPPVGSVLLHCHKKDDQVKQISDLCSLNICVKCKNTHCLISMIFCNKARDSWIWQNLTSQWNDIHLNETDSPKNCV